MGVLIRGPYTNNISGSPDLTKFVAAIDAEKSYKLSAVVTLQEHTGALSSSSSLSLAQVLVRDERPAQLPAHCARAALLVKGCSCSCDLPLKFAITYYL
jgi:hypothetical protein